MFNFIVIFLLVLLVAVPYLNKSSNSSSATAEVPHSQSDTKANLQPNVSPLDQLEAAIPDAISPNGDMAEVFKYGSNFTDLQRQLKLKEIQGKVIEWRLPVYEVKQSGDGYLVQTSNQGKDGPIDSAYVGTFIHILPRSDDDRRFVERIKTGDYIKIKGVIEDVTLRNIDIKPAIIVDSERLPRQILSKTYGKYMPKYDCWQTFTKNTNGENQYCMKLGRVDELQVGGTKRIYVLALGNVADDEGKAQGIHPDTGLLGAFVADVHNGQAEVVASNATLAMGAFGEAPKEWKFVKLSPSDYWGWQSSVGDCHMGECSYEYVVLAPHGKTIKNLAGFGGFSSDADATDVKVDMSIDTSLTSVKVYPLRINITEEKDGKVVERKTFKVPFNEKIWAWEYPRQ